MEHVLQMDAGAVGTTASVAITGEVDLASVTAVESRLAEMFGKHPETLVLDLSGVAFIDSTGVRLLIHTARRAADDGVRLAMICPDGPARRVLDLCGLEDVLGLVDGPSAAMPIGMTTAGEAQAAR